MVCTFGWKIAFKNEYLNCALFIPADLLRTFKVSFPQVIPVGIVLFIKSQFATNARNILHLNQCTQEDVWPWTVTPFEMPSGCYKRFGRNRNESVKSLRFQLEQNEVWRTLGRNCLPTHVEVMGFLVLVWELIPEVSPLFQTHPVYSLLVHQRVHKSTCF